jgi:threonine/homoserine/homoserine lactone efflux protein
VINVLNPKVALFFLAFLPPIHRRSAAPSKALAFIGLGCVFNFNSLFTNLPVAWLSAQAGTRVRTHATAARWLSGAVGGLFVALAARLATLERN